MRIFGIRGAACAENNAESIIESTVDMCNKIIAENNLQSDEIVSVNFTLTKDLTAYNPATAFRKNCPMIDFSKVALFTSQEAYIDGGPEKMIRVLFTAYLPINATPHHVYIRGAEKVRPDLSANS